MVNVLFIIMVPLWITFNFAIRQNDVAILGACAGLVVYLVSALFTCSLYIWYINALAGVLWLTLIFYAVYMLHSKKIPIVPGLIVFPAIGCLILTISIYGIGCVLLAAMPTKTKLFVFRESQQNESGVIIYPQHRPNNGVIIYFHDKNETILDSGKNTLRPLAEDGFVVVSIDYRLQGREGLKDAVALLNWVSLRSELQKMPIFLCGSGLGGRISVLTACQATEERLKAVGVFNTETEWPFPDLSPLSQIMRLHSPLLLLYAKDNPVDLSRPQELLRQANLHGKDVSLLITDDDATAWPNTLGRVSTYFLTHR